MNRKDAVIRSWEDYELLDSGDGMKLERYGSIILARPETQALWKKSKPEVWKEAHATFKWQEGKGSWIYSKEIPESWTLKWGDVTFAVRPTLFKHTGVFPEQAANWEWLSETIKSYRDVTSVKTNVLNLFGYTGIATLISVKAGAYVTHVDASKQSLDWVHENARLSGLPEESIRYICDDALGFAKREVRRGSHYEGIILDPPAFGRGPKGEVWKIEENLQELIEVTKELLTETLHSFYLLNGYAAGYGAVSFAQLIESFFGQVDGTYGDLNIQESHSDRVVTAGIYAHFLR
ncbi:MAG TPA: class I SAM-dependent methyltransferase [Candidatus Paceibacterota bacterium]|nr:class I SAM-dependent methyltransferase [Candidatus Paceibacterota bacterium]